MLKLLSTRRNIDMFNQDEILPSIIYSTQKSDIVTGVALVKKIHLYLLLGLFRDNFEFFLLTIKIGKQGGTLACHLLKDRFLIRTLIQTKNLEMM